MISTPLEKILSFDGGIQKLLAAWAEEEENLRRVLESKALASDREAAVCAGRLDGFRRAVYAVIEEVYAELSAQSVSPPPPSVVVPGPEEGDLY